MKLVLKTLAVVALTFAFVGCGERPIRPKALSQTGGTNTDSVAAPLSKSVVHVVTTQNLDKNKKYLKVKVGNEVIASECPNDTLVKLADFGDKVSIIRDTGEFGSRGVYVVSEYAPVGDQPMKSVKFDLVAAESCAANSPAKLIAVNEELILEEQTGSESTDGTAPKKCFFGYCVVKADM